MDSDECDAKTDKKNRLNNRGKKEKQSAVLRKGGRRKTPQTVRLVATSFKVKS